MRRVVRVLGFPAIFVAGVGGALLAMGRVGDEALVGLIFLVNIGLIAALERWMPYQAGWNRARGDLGADLAYLPMTLVINGTIEPAVRLIALALGATLAAALGTGLWPAAWPLIAQLALACVIAEFFDYWAHRLLHEQPWLWRLHATHHSAERLYWLNATRAHPGEILLRGAIGVLPLALLGAGREVFVLLGVVNVVVGFWQHANVAFALGPLSWIFSIGDVHRWHHARRRAEADCNYGNNFLFWDVVFGTRALPADRPPPTAVGIEGLEAFPRRLSAQLTSPWRWPAIERASARP